MPKREPNGLKLRSLEIKNFKAFDSFQIEFPPPRMKGDADIVVMGSKNGLGKTSVLESAALLFIAAVAGEGLSFRFRFRDIAIDLPDLLIRVGAKTAELSGRFESGGKNHAARLVLSKSGKMEISASRRVFGGLVRQYRFNSLEFAEEFLVSLVAQSFDPLILPPLVYFHSYRKVREGNPELGMMVGNGPIPPRRGIAAGTESSISAFKIEILRLLMSRGNLFEEFDAEGAEISLKRLNGLVERYAGGTIEKLRPLPDNTVDFRISMKSKKASIPFDGLSSGQKEIISTLFLIWRYSRKRPAIVLIDEPELHLNAEWHGDFVNQLQELAPLNQYIIATHSEDVFASVPEDRRVLLLES